MEADMVALREENANLWEIIKTKFDDVEKGEGMQVVKKPVRSSKVAELKAFCIDMSKSTEPLPKSIALDPTSDLPQSSTRLSEKEQITAQGKIMMGMVLEGQCPDVVTNPLAQKQL